MRASYNRLKLSSVLRVLVYPTHRPYTNYRRVDSSLIEIRYNDWWIVSMHQHQRYDVMIQCWREVPEERPSFAQIRSELESVMQRDKPYLDLDVELPCCGLAEGGSNGDGKYENVDSLTWICGPLHVRSRTLKECCFMFSNLACYSSFRRRLQYASFSAWRWVLNGQYRNRMNVEISEPDTRSLAETSQHWPNAFQSIKVSRKNT